MEQTCTRCGKKIYGSAAAHGCKPGDVYEFMSSKLASQRVHGDRRERIATAAMHGILAAGSNGDTYSMAAETIARDSIEYADALIAKLDARPKEAQ